MNDPLKQFKDQLEKSIQTAKTARFEADRKKLLSTVGADVAQMLTPVLNNIASSAQMNKQDMRDAMNEVLSQITSLKTVDQGIDTKPLIDAIEKSFNTIRLPEPKVSVNIPKLSVLDMMSKVQMPDEMNVKGWVQLQGVDLANPLPVQLRDNEGNPVNLADILARMSYGGGGGKTIVDIGTVLSNVPVTAGATLVVDQVSGANWSVSLGTSSLGASIIDSTGVAFEGANPFPVTLATGSSVSVAAAIIDSSGVEYSGSNPVPVTIASGSNNSVAASIIDSTGVPFEGANPFPITIITSATASVNAALTDSGGTQYSGSNPVPVTIASGSNNSVAASIIDSTGVPFEGANPFPITIITSATASVNAALTDSGGIQYSGSNPVPVVLASGSSNSVASSIIDSSGIGYSGSNPVPITWVSGSGASVAANIVDSSGVAYSGSNPVPITGNVNVNGSLNSVLVTGPSALGVADDGSAPVQFGGIARTTNPTKMSDGQVVKQSYDAVGRGLTRLQARGLLQTAYAQFSTGTEATLLAGVASTFLDLVYLMMSNNSDAAVSVDVRAGTANGVVMTVQVPANGTAGVAPKEPVPQDVAANTWTVDLPDITGTTISVSALFSKEV